MTLSQTEVTGKIVKSPLSVLHTVSTYFDVLLQQKRQESNETPISVGAHRRRHVFIIVDDGEHAV